MSVKGNFIIRSNDFEPAYLSLYRNGELQRRAQEAVENLNHCLMCPRDCGVDRLANKMAACKTGRYARVASYFPHHGEEDPLRGWNGSGTIFFAWCNLRCVFCQNHDISQEKAGEEVKPERLATMMIELQKLGCHNINFVTPEHVVPQILEALPIAIEKGLRLPLVYNTSAYDSMESLRLMAGVVDIYMPDFKMWKPENALKYLLAKDYPDAARCAIQEMHRQVGELKMDERGIAKRGVLVRHLVMPNEIADTKAIMKYLAGLSPHIYVNVMGQYHPAHRVGAEKFREINRRITRRELNDAITLTREAGLYRLNERFESKTPN